MDGGMPTVVDAAAAVRRGDATATDLVEQCLAAIDERDDELNAWVVVDADGARAAAAAIDAAVQRGDDPGPLAGVPFGVKDLEDCAGLPTTRGSRWFVGGLPAERDAIHVARLRAAGAIPIGKTTTPEFGAWAYTASPALGVTRNPYDPTRTPGGSSGGSAAAVAAGMVPFCTASDGGGSTRTPASFCGLVGHKPSFGRIPAYDIARYAQTGVRGALTTTVRDSARLLDVMAGPSRNDRTSLPAAGITYEDVIETLDVAGLRAAWSSDLGFAVVDPEVAAICEAAARELIDAAGLRRVDRTIRWRDPVAIWTKLEGVDRWIDLPDGLYPDRVDELDQLARGGWDTAARATLPKFGRVLTARTQLEDEIAAVFDDVDVVITPATATPAFAAQGPMPTEICGTRVHGGMTVIFPMFANVWGSPAICVPAGRTATSQLPVGLQIMADRHRDDVCLRLARVYEQARPWPRLAPNA